MTKVTPPAVTVLAEGAEYTAKQMRASAGDLLPDHVASLESILFVHEGECILHIHDDDVTLKPGMAYAIPPETRHQIRAVTDFRGIHIMPKSIRFKYF